MTDKTKEYVTIVLIKNYWEGYVQSIAWFLILAIVMSFAVWIESNAMQWVMALIWFLALISWVAKLAKNQWLTPEQAIKEIQKYIDEQKAADQ